MPDPLPLPSFQSAAAIREPSGLSSRGGDQLRPGQAAQQLAGRRVVDANTFEQIGRTTAGPDDQLPAVVRERELGRAPVGLYHESAAPARGSPDHHPFLRGARNERSVGTEREALDGSPALQPSADRAGGRGRSVIPSSVATPSCVPSALSSTAGADLATCRRVSGRPVRAFRSTTSPLPEALHDPATAAVDEPGTEALGRTILASLRGKRQSQRRLVHGVAQREQRVRRRLRAHRLSRQEQEGGGQLVAALARERAGFRGRPLVHHSVARDEREDEQRDRHGRDAEACAHHHALAAGGRAAAREDVLALERGGPGSLRARREPAFRRHELGAAQEEAAIAARLVPFERLQQPVRVLSVPLEVGVERLHEPVDAAVEVAVADRDPVAYSNALGDLLVGHPRKASGTIRLFSSTA